MRTRIYNAKICTMIKNTDIFTGEIWIKDGLIEYQGEDVDTKEKFDRNIDAKGNLILPGFKNGHSHSAMTFLRSYADDMPLLDWLFKQVAPMEEKLVEQNIDKEKDLYVLNQLAILEYLSSGITANFDMYFDPDAIANASINSGFRTVLCLVERNMKTLEDYFNKYKNHHELITAKFGFHAEYTHTTKSLTEAAQLVNSYKETVHTHNSESKKEVLECIERTGKTPTRRMIDCGLFKYGGSSFHSVHLTDEDISLFKQYNISVITNPGSNVKLASGIAPIHKFLDNGIKVGIGTDGPASNNSLDMFWEMKLTSMLQKIQNDDASALPANKVLEMACKTGAEIIGLENSNSLDISKNADLIMIDLNMPNMQPENNIIKNIVYAGSKINIKMTMIAGKILYENGEYNIGIDEEKIYAKANAIIKKLTS